MIDIIPAILPRNYEDMKNKVSLLRGVVSVAQIDICDGSFVSSKSWPFSTGGFEDFNFVKILNEEEGMPFWEDIDFELDLMVADAIENFDIYAKLSPKRMIFHLDAAQDLTEFKNFIEGIDVYVRDVIQIGIAVNINTPTEQIFPFINDVDFIQCMGIEHIGYQGEPFDERVLDKIKVLKEKYPDLIISVDGGVSYETAQMLIDAGVSRLVAGSAIFKTDDVRGAISDLESLQ